MSRFKKSDLDNLLDETIENLTRNGHTIDEVEWVGTRDICISWSRFAELAKEINYFTGYGSNEIDMSLVVVGKNWWLERHEYDGMEWWEYKQLPKKGKNSIENEVTAINLINEYSDLGRTYQNGDLTGDGKK